jgi:hypothetical protein
VPNGRTFDEGEELSLPTGYRLSPRRHHDRAEAQITKGAQAFMTIHRVNNDRHHNDPAIGALLQFLAKDMQANPGRLQAFSPDLMASIGELVEGIEVDLDAPIGGEVAI